MTQVVGVVDILSAPGREDALVAALEACATQTHGEPGCLTYALHRDNATPGHFVILERWRSQEDLDAHLAQPWVADLLTYGRTAGNLAAAPSLTFHSAVPLGDPVKGVLG